ncbi:MAG: 5-(carboxyamino)imidazole ribonucleotide synthase [Rhizobiaceae bacterium]|nr:5-(carboxyamino)imidazole ribonucleotide synthase [Rhizobiaceae bacterium]
MAIASGSHIGIIGGGQLGRMLAMAAARIGYKTMILDPAEGSPAFEVADKHIVAKYDDPEALKQLAEACFVITYEFENVDVSAVEALESRLPCRPGSNALATSQDRLVEKTFFNDLGIETAPFKDISSRDDLVNALDEFGGKGILKTRRLGYDGKGQVRVNRDDKASIEEAVDLAENTSCILEGFVPFEREVSVIAARSPSGKIAIFDLAENIHKDGILFSSTIPAQATEATQNNARTIADKVLRSLEYVGILAIEFFLLEDGSLLVNEFAPRVHNSGHWTEAACTVSQFEQHIRAITDQPLGNPDRHSNCVMQNLLGDDVNQAPRILEMPQTMLHLYGKEEARDGRKMGHFTKISPIKAD